MTVGTDVTIHIWYDEAYEAIKKRVGNKLTSVNNRPESKRGNPSLYKKLAKELKAAGKKFPAGVL